jgi:histidine triad (HIT) family protein
MTEPCIFCAIVAGEAPARMVAADDAAVAFLDIFPMVRGHALVIPRRHCRDIRDCPPEDLAAVAALAQRVAGAAFSGLGADGVNLVQANGEAAFQTIFHFHVHVLPRYAGDGFTLPFGRTAGDPAELDADVDRYRGGGLG